MRPEIGDNLSILIILGLAAILIAFASWLFHLRQIERIKNGSEFNERLKDAEDKVSRIRDIVG